MKNMKLIIGGLLGRLGRCWRGMIGLGVNRREFNLIMCKAVMTSKR